MPKPFPLAKLDLERIIAKHPTPFHLYDEAGMRTNARALTQAFSWAPAFKNYFALKATPTPVIQKILKEEGMGMDCSSHAELILSQRAGIVGENIMFTSNNTPHEDFKLARDLGAIINLDDISHIDYLKTHVGLPGLLCFRYNPGPLRGGNAIIGNPVEAKYGFTREQLFEGYRLIKDLGVTRFGLHTMVVSNELNPQAFVDTAKMLFELAIELKKNVGIQLEFVNLGGGIGIPYKPEDSAVDLHAVGEGVRQAYESMVVPAGLHPLKIFMENGRMVTGPFGFLVTRALHYKNTYKNYIGVDASMANLMRPGMYGAYHHITVVGKEQEPATQTYDVVGSLCENNDKFAVDRKLPKIDPGDLLVIHDAGAHGYAMGFNYNGKLRSAELLLQKNHDVQLIRRGETLEDYFSTMVFP